MSEKKDPAATGFNVKPRFNKQQREYRRRGKTCKVEVYREGCRFVSPQTAPKGQPVHLQGLTRGEIKGWSHRSRKSMRDYMLTHAPAPGYDAFALTLTVPGPPLTRPEWEKIWNLYSVTLRRAGGAAIWRKELQAARQAVHWHLFVAYPVKRSDRRTFADIITPPPAGCAGFIPHNGYNPLHDIYSATKKPRDEREAYRINEDVRQLIESGIWESVLDLWRMWFQCLDTLGPGVHVTNRGGTIEYDSRIHLPGAWSRACLVEYLPESKTGWNRYLLDHTTKRKQAQIAEHHGRHWGVINRKVFQPLTPEESALTWQAYTRLLRAYNRLCRPYIHDEKALFGRRRGRSYRRGAWGSYAAFVNPDTVRRMLEWAKDKNV